MDICGRCVSRQPTEFARGFATICDVGGQPTTPPTAAAGFRFHFCPHCGSNLYWEGDRDPAVCGVAVGAFDPASFPPPSDSIWEESMHRWLGLPSGTVHHERARPPAST